MRTILIYHLLPLFISVISLFGFLKLNVAKKISPSTLDSVLHSPNTILLIGSSELTGRDSFSCKPYNFFPTNGNYNCVGLGNAGFQSMGIMAKLYPYKHLLANAKITLIVSPGWFQDDYAAGTSTNIMLQYLSEREIMACLPSREEKNVYSCAIAKWMSDHFEDINTAGTENKQLYYESFPKWIQNSWLALPYYSTKLSFGLKTIYFGNKNKETEKGSFFITKNSEVQNRYHSSIDSLERLVQEYRKSNCNNPLGVENTLYETEYKGKTKKLRDVPRFANQEMDDFNLLLSFLKDYKANVKLIVQSLHPAVYENLQDLENEMSQVRSIIDQSGFTTLDLFTFQKSDYNTTLLRDAMHMSDIGWLKVNRFMLQEYGIEK